MRIMNRVIGFCVSVFIVILIASSVFFDRNLETLNQNILKSYQSKQIAAVKGLIDIENDDIKSIVRDYSVWQEHSKALQRKDKEWINENVIQYLYEEEKNNYDLVFIINEDKTFSEYKSRESSALGFSKIKKVEESFLNFEKSTFIERIDNEFFLISCSPVIDSYKKPHGMLYLGKNLKTAYIEQVDSVISTDGARIHEFKKSEFPFVLSADNQLVRYPIKIDEENILTIEFGYDISEYFSMTSSMFKMFKSFRTIILVVIVISIYFIMKSHSDELTKIVNSLKKIAKGDYTERLDFKDSMESKELSKNLNAVVSTISAKIKELEKHQIDTINIILKAVEEKDEYTKGHGERVGKYAELLTLKLGYTSEYACRIKEAGFLHDIGKIGIDDSILNKTGKLTDLEYNEIKSHPVRGFNILSDAKYFENIISVVRSHHERYDGKGYPDELIGKQIPLAARVVGIADALDAITSNRTYRNARTFEEAVQIIEEGSGTQFDPLVVKCFIDSKREMRLLYETLKTTIKQEN